MSGRIDTAVASAGTGKTTRLVEILSRTAAVVAPERILATTFTVKAADELVRRSRAKLVAFGRIDEASALLSARMGTVNAVCGRILSEFPFELGRSPASDVLDEDEAATVFACATETVAERFATGLNELALGFGLEFDAWRAVVRRIVDTARVNGIDADALASCADRSVREMRELLGAPAVGDGSDLEEELGQALAACVDAISGTTLYKTSEEHAALVRSSHARLGRRLPLTWEAWVRLALPRAAKKDLARFEAVTDAAGAFVRHPGLTSDVEGYVTDVFACAAASMQAFEDHKAARGLVDFVDQEVLALRVLRMPGCEARLRERIGAVLVDEYQDSSPLQVAVFRELARLSPESLWVGDPKQAIYGFRGTDSALTMAALASAATGTGGSREVLSTSYRSRPGIVRFCDDAFTPAFVGMGLPEEESRYAACAFDDAGFADVAALSVWTLPKGKLEVLAARTAGAVSEALGNAVTWPVRDRSDGSVRPLRSGDVAVLCRNGVGVGHVASALASLGHKVAVSRDGLLHTPEVVFVLAALAWTVDGSNGLALAEMARLVGGDDHGRWFDAVQASDTHGSLGAMLPFLPSLVAVREGQGGLTPSESLDAVMDAVDIHALCCRWGDPAERLADVEELRGLARTYEDRCSRARGAATMGGLSAWLAGTERERPASVDPDAVQVMTYHRAKGLEWPMVVLCDLASEPRADLFTPHVVAPADPDGDDPLAGRHVRFWPWPFGRTTAGVPLLQAAEAGPVGRAAVLEAAQEAVRLLYVGATRARDHLVLVRPEGKELTWLDGLGPEAVVFPEVDGDHVLVNRVRHPARCRMVTDELSAAHDRKPGPGHLSARADVVPVEPTLYVTPSATNGAPDVYRTGERITLGSRLPLAGQPEMDALGNVFHVVFGSDRPDLPRDRRVARAQAVMEQWEVDAVTAENLVVAADRLWSWLESRYPGARVLRELPLTVDMGDRILNGRLDLLIEGDTWFVVVDHKTFPGAFDTWERRVVAHGPQLRLYGDAVAPSLPGKECKGLFVHLPVVGIMLEVLQCFDASMLR